MTLLYIRLLDDMVQICFAGVWGNVCGDTWTADNVRVVCKELGFSQRGGLRLIHYDPSFCFPGSLKSRHTTFEYFLHGVNCDGSESRLFTCPYEHFDSVSCNKVALAYCRGGGAGGAEGGTPPPKL